MIIKTETGYRTSQTPLASTYARLVQKHIHGKVPEPETNKRHAPHMLPPEKRREILEYFHAAGGQNRMATARHFNISISTVNRIVDYERQ